MAHALELNFDPRTEGLVRALWEKLAEKSLGTKIELADRPHVTLSVAEQVDEAAFVEWLRHFSVQLRSFDLLYQAVGCFPGDEGVLYLQPTVTLELLEVHQGFYDSRPESWQGLLPYYLPGRWVPHCTLAVGLGARQLQEALAIALQASFPIVGQYEALSLIEIAPDSRSRVVETFGI